MAAPNFPGVEQLAFIEGQPQATMHDPRFMPFDFNKLIDDTGGIGKVPGGTVAIIGAGLTGLLLANRLVGAGFEKVVIFEAQSEVGGRLECHGLFQDGAMRIGVTSAITLYIMAKFGVGMVPGFPNPGKVDTLVYFNGKLTLWPAGKEPPPEFRTVNAAFDAFRSQDIEFANGDRLLALSKIRNLLRAKDPETRSIAQPEIQKWIDVLEKMNSYEMFRRFFMSDDIKPPNGTILVEGDIKQIGDGGFGTGPAHEIFLRAAYQLIEIVLHGHEIDQGSFAILGKEGNLVRAPIVEFAKRLADHVRSKGVEIRLNTKVTAVGKANGNYLVMTDRWEPYSELAVCTAPHAILNNIKGLPQLLGDSLTKKLESVVMVDSSKVFFYVKDDLFKEFPDFPPCLVTDQVTKASFVVKPEGGKEGYVLVSYTWGNDAKNQSKYGTAEQQLNAVLKEYRDIIGKSEKFRGATVYLTREAIGDYDVKRWGEDEYTNGGFGLAYPGDGPSRHALTYDAVDPERGSRPYILCVDADYKGGWCEASPEQANRAAYAIVNKHGKVHPRIKEAASWDMKAIKW